MNRIIFYILCIFYREKYTKLNVKHYIFVNTEYSKSATFKAVKIKTCYIHY